MYLHMSWILSTPETVLNYQMAVWCFAFLDMVSTVLNIVAVYASGLQWNPWQLLFLLLLVGPICGLIGSGHLNRSLVAVFVISCLVKAVIQVSYALYTFYLWTILFAFLQCWITKIAATFWWVLGNLTKERRRQVLEVKNYDVQRVYWWSIVTVWACTNGIRGRWCESHLVRGAIHSVPLKFQPCNLCTAEVRLRLGLHQNPLLELWNAATFKATQLARPRHVKLRVSNCRRCHDWHPHSRNCSAGGYKPTTCVGRVLMKRGSRPAYRCLFTWNSWAKVGEQKEGYHFLSFWCGFCQVDLCHNMSSKSHQPNPPLPAGGHPLVAPAPLQLARAPGLSRGEGESCGGCWAGPGVAGPEDGWAAIMIMIIMLLHISK